MEKWLSKARTLWIACSAGLFAFCLFFYARTASSDAEIFLIYGMLTLAFPCSLAVSAVLAGLIAFWEQPGSGGVQTSYLSMTVYWLAQFLGGYVQWFLLLPAAFRLAKRGDREEKGRGDRPGK